MIHIKGARQNNLKRITLSIPTGNIIAITGVSGSGKSSFAIDTLYAEGQRRYIETFSPYTRQFLERISRPDVERIENIPPSVAIGRKFPAKTGRSTVATASGISDYLKLLFPRISELHCERCGRKVEKESAFSVWEKIKKYEGKRAIICFSAFLDEKKKKELISKGFTRAYMDGETADIERLHGEAYIVVDRLRISSEKKERIIDSVEQAFRFGDTVCLFIEDKKLLFSKILLCPYCKIKYRNPFPALFSFNNPVGACKRCNGFGRIIDIDLGLVIDEDLSIKDGAIRIWRGKEEFFDLLYFCKEKGIPVDVPFRKLDEEHRRLIIDGTDGFYGIRGYFRWLEKKRYKLHVRVYLSRYRDYVLCPECGGKRFTKEALLYKINGLSIADIYGLSIDEAKEFFDSIKVSEKASLLILNEIRQRLSYLQKVGLGYLTLERQSKTLSAGELQRLSLTSALSSSLVDSLYIIDEPSFGLHPRDTERLIETIRRIRDMGNTVIVIEHDPQIIKSSDLILDLGPGAGENGGRIVYFGPFDGIKEGLTADYLKGKKSIPVPEKRRKPKDFLYIRGAGEHNLKDINVRIPLHLFVCITGVSGSGKSTLAEEIIYKGIKWIKGEKVGKPGRFKEIIGAEKISDVILVDQSPIGKTPRGNILTYTKAMDTIRKIFSETDSAKKKGLSPSYFSFNVPGGRCETCKGEGFERIEMQFLPDIFVRCPDCKGKRYKDEVLEIRYKGKSIVDVFDMTVDDAIRFFSDNQDVIKRLSPLSEIGLGYLRLGQPINTLSGGEAQRLKLSRFLSEAKKDVLLIVDEPTEGLHPDDIKKLIDVFHRLVDSGISLIVIEHNLDVIKNADWIIDLGPEGGKYGGEVVAEGEPEDIMKVEKSYTGRYLKSYIEGKKEPIRKEKKTLPPFIFIKGARENNLKNIDLAIPRKKLVVITGVSGSGKSSLVYDVIFSEGQRRYLECLSPYIRQYIKKVERADVDYITGIPPTVAIEQRISQEGKRSTVGTITEIYHFLRLLFSKIGKAFCPRCGKELKRMNEEEIIRDVIEKYREKEAIILVPKVLRRKGIFREIFEKAKKKGIRNARIDGKILEIKENIFLERYKEHTVELVFGKTPCTKKLLSEAINEGDGTIIILDGNEEKIFSKDGICPQCKEGFGEIDPLLFSFNTKHGACEMCDGFGEIDGDVCPECHGSRLNRKALSVKIHGYSIWDMTRIPAKDLFSLLRSIPFSEREKKIAEPILKEIFSRLSFMERLGISYLSLSRSADSLSGGEAQRVRFSAQLGSNLSGVCYILDEPTIGLHPRDTEKLIDALKMLRDKGNSVIVVEHDEDVIKSADYVIEIGPGAGKDGGRVVAKGTVEQIKKAKDSVTGKFLCCKHKITSRLRPYKERPKLKVIGAYEHNLKGIDVEFPLNTLICVTGVSGSGKSSLIKDVLYEGMKQLLSGKKISVKCRSIEGWHHIKRVSQVDHRPIGKTPRSIPASYIGIYDQIRRLFSATEDAKKKGYTASRFSFNREEGRCKMCKGFGYIKVSMSFLPDVYVRCEMCEGKRFESETLSVKYKGKDISEVLEMTFDEARDFFSSIPELKSIISLVCDIGLGYLKLGQPSHTLSGGEAQRIKLVREIAINSKDTLYILDEPTTGLHVSDIRKLTDILQRIVDMGNTVIVIEHNLELIKEADYIIDLGPEEAERGGLVVAKGSPYEILEADTYTAKALRDYLRTYS